MSPSSSRLATGMCCTPGSPDLDSFIGDAPLPAVPRPSVRMSPSPSPCTSSPGAATDEAGGCRPSAALHRRVHRSREAGRTPEPIVTADGYHDHEVPRASLVSRPAEPECSRRGYGETRPPGRRGTPPTSSARSGIEPPKLLRSLTEHQGGPVAPGFSRASMSRSTLVRTSSGASSRTT